MHPPSYRGCWHGVSRCLFLGYRQVPRHLPPQEKGFTNHGPSSPTRCRSVRLRAHCGIFPTAASRRSLGRVSVPVWPVTLSGRLPVVALVGHYPTNKLIGRGPIPHRKSFPPHTMKRVVLFGIRPSFPGLSRSAGQITHVLLTRSPLEYPEGPFRSTCMC